LGKYTIHDDLVDLEIDKKLRVVVECIVNYLKDNIQSILLTGGYGRGEGSVIIRNGEVILLKDFDIAIVVNKIVCSSALSLMLEDIYKKLGSNNPTRSLFKYSNFAVDLRYLTKDNINYPDIWFVDLKNSTLLYGKDIRSYITYDSLDIPLSSGLRLVFEKITGLLGHFEYRLLYKDIDENARMRLIYECMKTYIEIATSLCILNKVYISSYIKRIDIIKILSSKGKLDEIVRHIPDLIDKIELATRFKLQPDFNVDKDPIELFFITRNDLALVLKYYIKCYIGFEINNWLEIDRISKQLAKVYYKPMISAFVRNKNPRCISLVNILNILYQLYTNIKYIHLFYKESSKIYLGPLVHNSTISPSLKFFPAGLLILLSLNRDGSIDMHLLMKGIDILRNIIPIANITGWEDARQIYLKAYKYYLFPTLLK